uniref:Transmembrane protein n=1 Tax=Globodera rostochiensis TaxID=31243 RepID=A0A914H7I2_GLORO
MPTASTVPCIDNNNRKRSSNRLRLSLVRMTKAAFVLRYRMCRFQPNVKCHQNVLRLIMEKHGRRRRVTDLGMYLLIKSLCLVLFVIQLVLFVEKHHPFARSMLLF